MTNKTNFGITHPMFLTDVHFDYEVVDCKGEVKTVEYEDDGSTCTYLEKPILIKSLGGWSADQFVVVFSNQEAMTPLREGEVISCKLRFAVKEDEDGNYHQQITGSDLLTLNDYHHIREAQAFYEGKSLRRASTN